MTVPTITDFDNAALNLQTIEEVSNVDYSGDTTTNRTGTILDTLQGRLKKLGYEPAVAYAGSISFTVADNAKTIERGGLIYAPLASSLPFTTTGTWTASDENNFLLIAQDLTTYPAGIGLQYDDALDTQNFFMARFKVDGTTGAISEVQKASEFYGSPQTITLSTFGPFTTPGFPSANTIQVTVDNTAIANGLVNFKYRAIPEDFNRVLEFQFASFSLDVAGDSSTATIRMYTQSGIPTTCNFFIEFFWEIT